MRILHTADELNEALNPLRARGERIGFVPTMGALHAGHASLLSQSLRQDRATVLSIYVNPTQFGPNEDLAKYPRTLDKDLALAAGLGVTHVFVPDDATIYPPGYATFIDPGSVAAPLCGAFRPGHFRGVATVVVRLLNLVRPGRLYLGQKDLQQCLLLKQVLADLGVPVEVQICPTVREGDGLAMSSRNRYLSPAARDKAPLLYATLRVAREAYLAARLSGSELSRALPAILNEARAAIAAEAAFELQYLEALSLSDLHPLSSFDQGAVIAVAARLDGARLIDNVLCEAPAQFLGAVAAASTGSETSTSTSSLAPTPM